MSLFVDDFNRANGSLGGNWTAIAGTISITSNAATFGGVASSYNTTLSDTSYQEASANITWNNTTYASPGPICCIASDGTGGFTAHCLNISGTLTLRLASGGRAATGIIEDYTLPLPIPPMFTIRLVWDAGYLSVYYNGTLVIENQSALYIGNPYVGIGGYATYGTMLDFRAVSGSAIQLGANPSVIGNYGQCSEIALTGVNTDWTPGTPGSPIFTVNHGTISAQTVLTATTATITYCPGDYLGPVTITDPSTGQTTAIVVTSDPGTVPVGGIALSEAAIAYIERSAAAEANSYILNRTTDITTTAETTSAMFGMYETRRAVTQPTYPSSGDAGVNKLVMLLYGVLSGWDPLATYFDAPTTQTSVKQDTEQALDLIANLSDQGTISLVDVLTQLGGDPLINHGQLLAAINGVSIDPSEIIAEIHALRGAEGSTVEGAIALIQALATIAGYDLSDVRDWIQAAQGTGLPTIRDVLNKLLLIQPGNVPSLVDIDTHIVQQTTLQAMLDAITLLIRGDGVANIAGVLDAIDNLQFPPVEVDVNVPPTFNPDTHTMQLGTPIPFTAPFVHTGSCHGLLYTMTTRAQGVKGYMVGDYTALTGAGVAGFFVPSGHVERFQYMNWDKGLLLPLTMTRASGFVFSSNVSLSGTVTPFTLVPIA